MIPRQRGDVNNGAVIRQHDPREVAALTTALHRLDPRDWRDFEEWFALAGACKAGGRLRGILDARSGVRRPSRADRADLGSGPRGTSGQAIRSTGGQQY
jgi:hypothetical protein